MPQLIGSPGLHLCQWSTVDDVAYIRRTVRHYCTQLSCTQSVMYDQLRRRIQCTATAKRNNRFSVTMRYCIRHTATVRQYSFFTVFQPPGPAFYSSTPLSYILLEQARKVAAYARNVCTCKALSKAWRRVHDTTARVRQALTYLELERRIMAVILRYFT